MIIKKTKGIEHKEFKETEIGKIPKEWKAKKIIEIFNVCGGTTPSTSNDEFWNGEIPWVTPTDITRIKNGIYLDKTEKSITEKAIKECSLDVLNNKVLLLTTRATIGWIVINKMPVTINQGITALIPKKRDEIYTIFYAYYLQTLKSYLNQLGSGSTFKEISKNSLKNIIIPIPSFEEQKKIAEIFSSIDKGVEEVSIAITKTERLKKGLMQELLTKGIGREEFKDTKIGRMPKEWKLLEIKDAVDINKEFRDPRRELSNKKFFYIDIDSIENETGIIKNSREIIGKEAPSRARRQIRYNDVIMSTVRPYLKAFAIIPKLYDGQICSTGFAVLRCKERILPKFLLYILFSKSLVSQFNRLMVGAQYPALNSSQVKKLKIPLPPLPEQKKIAEILATVDERIQLLKEKKEKLGRVKKGLMNDLLTGRKRVKLEA